MSLYRDECQRGGEALLKVCGWFKVSPSFQMSFIKILNSTAGTVDVGLRLI